MRSGEGEREMERDLHTYMGLNFMTHHTHTHTHTNTNTDTILQLAFFTYPVVPQFLQGMSSKARKFFRSVLLSNLCKSQLNIIENVHSLKYNN